MNYEQMWWRYYFYDEKEHAHLNINSWKDTTLKFKKDYYDFQITTDREENTRAMSIRNYFENSTNVNKVITGLFGENVNFSTLLGLVVAQIYRKPDDYFKVDSKSLEEVITEKLTQENDCKNCSKTKLEYQSILKNLNNSDEEPFYAYMNFLWYSRLPCFDVPNLTAGARCQKNTVYIFKICWYLF